MFNLSIKSCIITLVKYREKETPMQSLVRTLKPPFIFIYFFNYTPHIPQVRRGKLDAYINQCVV